MNSDQNLAGAKLSGSMLFTTVLFSSISLYLLPHHRPSSLSSTSLPSAMTNLYSPEQATELLEEAQCDSPESAAKTLQSVTLHLRGPHPSVTSAALDLLQVYPLQTIPYIPYIIPAIPATVQTVMETFSDLLSADRTLLVPIIAALPSLPLSPAHHVSARATLSHALRVVDTTDLPAIVHAIANLSISAPSTARWAARALRTALVSPPPHPHTVAVLSHVLSNLSRPGNPVAAALRKTTAQPRSPTWLDLVVWLHALHSEKGPHADAYAQSRAAVKQATRSGLLFAAGPTPVFIAAPALKDVSPSAVQTFVRIVSQSVLYMRLRDLHGFTRLVSALLEACPLAASGVGGELLGIKEGWCSDAAEAALLHVLPMLPLLLRRAATTAGNAYVRVNGVVAEAADDGTVGWAGFFVSLRKTFLFGDRAQRADAIALAYNVAAVGSEDIVTELLSVMHASVPNVLGDPRAVAFLGIAAIAIMRGVMSQDNAKRWFQERIEQQCPDGMVVAIDADVAEDGFMRVDAGLIFDQNPATAAVVASSAAALALSSRVDSSLRDAAIGMVHITVLVPVICIPVYEAVKYWNQDFDLTSTRLVNLSGQSRHLQQEDFSSIPKAVTEMPAEDLSTTISAFAVAMSVIVGLLNVACTSMSLCHRVLQRRRDSGVLEEEKDDKKVLWAILERLTEFDRMLSAQMLGMGVLIAQAGNRKKSSETHSAEDELRDIALKKVEVVKDALLRSIFPLDNSAYSRKRLQHNMLLNLPRLSLNAAVCSLLAVPDEPNLGAICDLSSSKPERDIEQTRIDKMLLRSILTIITGSSMARTKKPSNEHMVSTSFHGKERSGSTVPVMENVQPGSSYSFLTADGDFYFADKEDPFYGSETDDEVLKEPEDTSGDNINIRWADELHNVANGHTNYLRAAASVFRRKAGNPSKPPEVTDILHSAEFAGLLLDRAATYTAVGRNAWQSSHEDYVLSNVTAVAGFALSCLIAVIRAVPLFISSDVSKPAQATVSSHIETGERDRARDFIANVDCNLLVAVPEGFKCACGNDDARAHEEMPMIAKLLIWIAQTSIDASVAALALEAVLTICELGCHDINCGRRAVLSSLCIVYECDGKKLWPHEDLSLVFADSFGEWCSQKRGVAHSGMNSINEDSLTVSELLPFVILNGRNGRKHDIVSQYRLNQFFEGMYIPSALREARGWVREISLLMKKDKDEGNKLAQTGMKPTEFRAQKGSGVASETRKEHAGHSSKCEILVDMLGFREVITTLIQLAQLGLEVFSIEDALAGQSFLDETYNPVAHMSSSLNLLGGILGLYQRNRMSLIAAATTNVTDKTVTARLDADFDHFIVNATISALQVTKERLDEVCSWCSNESINVSLLSQEAVQTLETVVGCAAEVVWQCSGLNEAIREQYSSLTEDVTANANETATDRSRAPARKSPGFAKAKRKRMRGRHEGDVSKARKLVPRLHALGEHVLKEAQKLAKTMGIRARKSLRKMAMVAPEDDALLGFGAGLEKWGSGDGEGEKDVEMEVVEEDNLFEEDVGFHARSRKEGGEMGVEQKTVTVNFKR